MTKSAPLFASVEELSEADIQAKIAELQAQLAEKARGKTIAEITELLIPSSIKELEAVKAFLLGKGTLTAPVKASKAVKASVKAPKGEGWAVTGGNVTYNGFEAIGLKTNKNDKVAVTIKGLKGAPPLLDNAPPEAKAILSKFSI